VRNSFRPEVALHATRRLRPARGAVDFILLLAVALAGCSSMPGSTTTSQASSSGPPPGSFVVHMNGQAGAAALIR
jgi:hypothetical protein